MFLKGVWTAPSDPGGSGSAGVDVIVDGIGRRGASLKPFAEKLGQPGIGPRGLFEQRQVLRERPLPRAAAEDAQPPAIEFERAVLAFGAYVIVFPAVERRGVRLRSFIEAAAQETFYPGCEMRSRNGPRAKV